MPKNNVLPKGEFFTTIPDYFLTHVMTELSASELRVILYIFLRTLGYGKLADAISYDQFLTGVITRDGRQLDKGAGVSRRSLTSALVSLEKLGIITRSHQNLRAATITLKLDSGISTPIVEAPTSCSKETLLSPQKEDGASKATCKPTDPKATSEGCCQPLEVAKTNFAPQTVKQDLPLQRTGEVQNLPLKEEKEVQNLPSTWRKKDNTRHEDINRVQSTAVPANIIKTVVEEVNGITEKEARRLVAIALNTHGRDQSYIERLVKYVTSSPTIENQAACLTSLIKADQDRTLPGEPSIRGQKPRKRWVGHSGTFRTGSSETSKFHPSAALPFNSSYLGDKSFSELLVRKHLVNDYSKAAYLVWLANENNVTDDILIRLVSQAEKVGPGQRSQSFEKLLNSAIEEAQAVSTKVSCVAFRQPIDLKKYQPGGKYGFLTS